eukprot:gene22773-28935_t
MSVNTEDTNYVQGAFMIQFDDGSCSNLRTVSFSDALCADYLATTPITISTSCTRTEQGDVAYMQSQQMSCVVGGPFIEINSTVASYFAESDTTCSGLPYMFDATINNVCLLLDTGGDDNGVDWESEVYTCSTATNHYTLSKYSNPDECAVTAQYPAYSTDSEIMGCFLENFNSASSSSSTSRSRASQQQKKMRASKLEKKSLSAEEVQAILEVKDLVAQAESNKRVNSARAVKTAKSVVDMEMPSVKRHLRSAHSTPENTAHHVSTLTASTALFCPYYNATNTASATQNHPTCSFAACGGANLTISGCGCYADQYLTLVDASGAQVGYSDDACNECSRITYTVPGASNVCSNYTLNEGCFGTSTCSGTVNVTGSISSEVTAGFVGFWPTAAPVVLPPTATPVSSAPTTGFQCPAYSASNTLSATQNAATCSFLACGGSTLSVSGCGACSDDQYLTLSYGGVVVASNDDACNSDCSLITYVVPGNATLCSTYTVNEGCYQAESCSGVVSVYGAVGGVTGSTASTNFSSPTYAPFAYPTLAPSVQTTIAPTGPSLFCPSYIATNTNSATQNYAYCSFKACGGAVLTVSGCGCQTDQFLNLVTNGTIVASNDDYCGACSLISYTVPGSASHCTTYTVDEGCYLDGTCAGNVTVTGASGGVTASGYGNFTPTAAPVVVPSAYPSAPTTRAPTFSPFTCPAYSAVNTNYATQNYPYCSFTACGGSTLVLSSCGACSGDQYLALYSNTYLVASDDYCDTCSQITYKVPGNSSACITYTVREGCSSNEACSGTVSVSGASSGVTVNGAVGTAPTGAPNFIPLPTPAPSAVPQFSPSAPPSVAPSASPTTAAPSESPTVSFRPSYAPFAITTDTLMPVPTFPTSRPSSSSPTSRPTSSAPSSRPSWAPYTLAPTVATFTCAPYSVSDNDFAYCSFAGCGGNTLSISGCGCSNDQTLALYLTTPYTTSQVAANDDSCGLCSVINYLVPGPSSECGNYTLLEGCDGSSACSGTVSVSGASSGIYREGVVNQPTQSPISNTNDDGDDDALPDYMLISCNVAAVSVAPSRTPTRYPTFGTPSRAPSVAGSTPAPTVANLIKFSASQVITGISYTTYLTNSSNYERTIKAAVAQTMTGVTPQNIIDFVVAAASSRRLTSGVNASISTSYTVSVNEQGQDFTSLSTQLQSAISSGLFNSYLGAYAAQYNAIALEGTTSSLTSVSNDISSSDSSDEDETIGGGAIAGIVIGVLIVLALFGAVAHHFLNEKKTAAPPHATAITDSTQAHNPMTSDKAKTNYVKKSTATDADSRNNKHDVGASIGDDNM